MAQEASSPPPLKAYEIEEMVMAIFQAFASAEDLAKAHVGGHQESLAVGETDIIGYVDEDDCMDWE